MDNLVSLPRDILIEMLDRLPVNNLISILTSNRQLYSLYPRFQEKIEQYEAIRYATPNYIKLIEKEQKCINDLLPFRPNIIYQSIFGPKNINIILLKPTIANLLNLNRMPVDNSGRTIYTNELLELWWIRYLIKNNLIIDAPLNNITATTFIIVDDLINLITHMPIGSTIPLMDLLSEIPIIIPGRRTIITEEIVTDLCREKEELL